MGVDRTNSKGANFIVEGQSSLSNIGGGSGNNTLGHNNTIGMMNYGSNYGA
jgi:hypothetical protein